MIRLLVADDEISACNDMIRCIDWDKYGIEIAGVARDGPETYEMILEHRPDIVLIDIEMPGMSGIEVIQKIGKECEPRPSFIIVSGYDDFSYAQQAIELDVDQYLLKPFLPAHLLKAIHRSVEKLEILRQKDFPSLQKLTGLWQSDDAEIPLSYPAREERQVIKAIQCGSSAEIDAALNTFWEKASGPSPNSSALLFSSLLLCISIVHLLFDHGISQLPSLTGPDGSASSPESSSLVYLRQLAHAAKVYLDAGRTDPAALALRAAAYISEHYQSDLNLDVVAQAIYVSPSYLSGRFSQTMGMGFVEYVHHTRIEHAKDLLLNTHLKIYQIAEQVGYSDQKYFAQIFKKFTGRTPGEFRSLSSFS